MKKRYLIPCILVGLLLGRVFWVSRPEPPDHAELTDTCEFEGFPNSKYRALIAEAKALVDPHRRTIKYEADYNVRRTNTLPTLARLTRQFVLPSNSTTETIVRMFAMARAFDGRMGSKGEASLRTVGSDAASKQVPYRVHVELAFQAPGGTVWVGIGSWLELRLWGRRYDFLALETVGHPYRDYASPRTTPDEMIPGTRIDSVSARWNTFFSFMREGGNLGDVRLPHDCPDIGHLLSRTGFGSVEYSHQKALGR
jgi:hypothetical protein